MHLAKDQALPVSNGTDSGEKRGVGRGGLGRGRRDEERP